MGARDREDSFPVVGMSSQCHMPDRHTIFVDVENATYKDIERWLDGTRYETYAILRSSADGYHVVIPVVKPESIAYGILKACPIEDEQHCEIGHRRGSWVLRLSPKSGVDKPQPELVYSTQSFTDTEDYSIPHMELLNAVHDRRVFSIPDEGRRNMKRFDHLRVEKYWTWK